MSTGPIYDDRWQSIALELDNGSNRKDLKDYVSIAQANTWYFARVPLTDLNNADSEFYQLAFFNYSGNSGVPVYIDNVVFELDDAVEPPPDPEIGESVSATINATQTSPISPYIYGINTFAASERFAQNAGLHRAGGNRWSAYNWENNASNAGSDYIHHSDNYILWSMGLGDQGSIPGRAGSDPG